MSENKKNVAEENVAEELLVDDVAETVAAQGVATETVAETVDTEAASSDVANEAANSDGVNAEGTAQGGEGVVPATELETTAPAAVEKPLTEREKFLALGKEKAKITDFTAYTMISAKYSVEEGLGLIVNHLRTRFFNLDEEFMKRVQGKTAFVSTKLYAPVYRMKAKANYYWKKGNKAAVEEYCLSSEVDSVATQAPDYLKPTELVGQSYSKLEAPMADEKLLLGKKISLKECVKLLKGKAEAVAPDKKAEIILTEEQYELAYVPVLKAEITYDGKTYTQWVNLVNGECQAEYAVSPAAVAAAEKTMQKLGQRKRMIFGCFLYSLTFTVLNILFWQLSPLVEGVVGKGLEGTTVTLILGGVSALILAMWFTCFAYKKQKLVDRAVKKGKAPSAKGAALFALLSLVAAAVSVALFTVFVLL